MTNLMLKLQFFGLNTNNCLVFVVVVAAAALILSAGNTTCAALSMLEGSECKEGDH